MNSKEIKQVRGQIRQVVEELFPLMMTDELMHAMEDRLAAIIHARMDQLDKQVQQMRSYIIRETTRPDAPVAAPAAETPAPQTEPSTTDLTSSSNEPVSGS